MLRRSVAVAAFAALAFAVPSATAAPAPQLTDPSGDANFVNGQGLVVGTSAPANESAPAGSQDYADVTSVQWQTTKVVKKVNKKTVTIVTGFTVTATLAGNPTPPTGTTIVYRMLGTTANCPFFGVAYYSNKLKDGTSPQSAVRDNCNGSATRLTPIALPVISGHTITWTVPLTAIPKDTKVKVGTQLTGLYFTVTEIEDFQGQQVPSAAPLLGGSTGLGYGVIDNSTPGDASFKIG